MALSLTVFYGIQYTVFVGDYKPSSFADYNKFRALQPGLRCSCGVQTSPFSNFASASVEMNPACEWVGPDLIGYAREVYCPDGGEDALGQCYDLSTCRSASNVPLCQATDESCKQSNQTIEWILQEFRNTPVSSTELLAQDTLENLANQTFESAIKLGSLISTTPVKTVEAWASANVPNLASMAGRGQEALSFAQGIMDLLKNFTLIALRDGIFANATAAEKKMYEDGANYQWNDDYFPPFVDYGRESDQRGKIPVWQLSISPCDGIYWETNTWLQGETNRYSIEINQLIYPYDQTWWDDQWSSKSSRDAQWDGDAYVGGCPSIDQCCLDGFRKCLYDCIYNGETFTDWNGYYASIPSWVPYDEAQNTAGHSVYPHYTMPGLTCTKTYVGPLWRNEFEMLTNGNFPLPPWITDEYDEYKFKKSGTSGCDPYSVALDTTYFAHDTPERYLLIKNASYDTAEKYLRDSAKAAGQPDPVFDNMGPGSRTDYVEKFAIPIMKRHGTVRNAISNLFIDEKVVSVNYEVSDPVFDLIFSDDPSVAALDTHHPSSPPAPPTPGLLQHMRHHHVHVHVQCTTLDRGAHVGHLRPHRRYRRLHEPLRRLRLRRLQGGCVERRGGSDGTRIFTRG